MFNYYKYFFLLKGMALKVILSKECEISEYQLLYQTQGQNYMRTCGRTDKVIYSRLIFQPIFENCLHSDKIMIIWVHNCECTMFKDM